MMYALALFRSTSQTCSDETQTKHVEFIDSLIQENRILLGGGVPESPENGTIGGYILRAESLDEALQTVKQDPYRTTGTYEAEVMEWRLIGINPDAIDKALILRPKDVQSSNAPDRAAPGLKEYETACAHDRDGEEAEAIPHYEKALELGLSERDRPGALVGLGSSLRNVGRHQEAVELLCKAVNEFPDDPALHSFLGLAQHSAGLASSSVATLLGVITEHVPLKGYDRALKFYRDEIKTSPAKGTVHHIEIYVSDLNRSIDFWDWLLKEIGYVSYQSWDRGKSWRKGSGYLVFVQTNPEHSEFGYHRCRTGLNHLAFHAGSRDHVDQVTDKLRQRGATILYEDKHPHAGGSDHYAVFFEDPDRIKVELVAP